MFTKKLFWVLVFGFMNLVSVDAKERSIVFNTYFSVDENKSKNLKQMICYRLPLKF